MLHTAPPTEALIDQFMGDLRRWTLHEVLNQAW